jgi:hypothetical protein
MLVMRPNPYGLDGIVGTFSPEINCQSIATP